MRIYDLITPTHWKDFKKNPIFEDYHDDQGHKTSQRRFQQECPNSHHHPNQQ